MVDMASNAHRLPTRETSPSARTGITSFCAYAQRAARAFNALPSALRQAVFAAAAGSSAGATIAIEQWATGHVPTVYLGATLLALSSLFGYLRTWLRHQAESADPKMPTHLHVNVHLSDAQQAEAEQIAASILASLERRQSSAPTNSGRKTTGRVSE